MSRGAGPSAQPLSGRGAGQAGESVCCGRKAAQRPAQWRAATARLLEPRSGAQRPAAIRAWGRPGGGAGLLRKEGCAEACAVEGGHGEASRAGLSRTAGRPVPHAAGRVSQGLWPTGSTVGAAAAGGGGKAGDAAGSRSMGGRDVQRRVLGRVVARHLDPSRCRLRLPAKLVSGRHQPCAIAPGSRWVQRAWI